MNLNLSNNIKGFLYLSSGMATLIYIHGWFQANLYYLLLVSAIVAMGYGFILTDLWDLVNSLVNRFRNK